MLGVEHWLGDLPPLLIYVIVGAIVLVESMGIPLPGEIVLISAALLTVTGVGHPAGVAIGASIGAIIGDSIGYVIGRRGGRALLERLGRRFPKHLGPHHLAKAESVFARWGTWTVFFGRFVALLRILAGPLAGALRVPYRKFLLANASGGILWATGTTVAIYYIGVAAEKWLQRFSWVALVAAVVIGLLTTFLVRRRAVKLTDTDEDDPPAPVVAPQRNAPTTSSKTSGAKSTGIKTTSGKTTSGKSTGSNPPGGKTTGTKTAGTKSAGAQSAGAKPTKAPGRKPPSTRTGPRDR